MTMTIQFDTLRYVEKLKSAGMPEAHAKASAEALLTALEQSILTTLATKDDIHDVKDDIRTLKEDIGGVKSVMNVVKAEFRTEFRQIRSEQKVMQWMLGTIVVGVVSLLAKSFF